MRPGVQNPPRVIDTEEAHSSMFTTTLWYVLGAIGMAVGTTYALWGLATDESSRRQYYLVLASVTGIATVAYVAMTLGVGRIRTNGAILYLPRYVDWLLTTPLLVLYLAMLARPRTRTYVELVVLEVLVIGSGATAAIIDPPLHWIAYGIGVLGFLRLLHLLLAVLPRQSALDRHRPAAVFTKLRNLTIVLWSIYPIVWLLGPFGTGLLLVDTEAIVVTYLDLLAKVGFVVIAVNGRDALRELDRTEATPG